MRPRALIAIVDDDSAARGAMVSLLEAMEFDARGFESALAFLGSDIRASTLCLVSDVRMPGMSGPDLHRMLHASGTAIPTILVTAYPDGSTQTAALEAGVHAYLAKPLDPDALLACILEALRAR